MLAGVSSFVGFPVRSSPRLKAKKKSMPIAQLAERLLCQRLDIVNEGDSVTKAAIAKFVQMFDGRLPDIALAAPRALFRLDCDFATAVEDTLRLLSQMLCWIMEVQLQWSRLLIRLPVPDCCFGLLGRRQVPDDR